MSLKEELYEACVVFVNKQAETIENIINSHKRSLQSETKSSAGDKHETGRAMLQLEMEKAGKQLASIQTMKEILAKINPKEDNKLACLGSVVVTNKMTYFLSISAGKINIEGENYFAVSVSSPIGRCLLGKSTDTEFVFNNVKYIIKEVF
ncbi:3-oxoacyl-ACP synthase [Tenacibaculum sp. 190524A02b]|uniref:3-oxoacyl-ACP synthase n=1 Tax=Tenacibaculum vairaonense TaxID=3137860 RepID=A0ABP1FC63_9FLAO